MCARIRLESIATATTKQQIKWGCTRCGPVCALSGVYGQKDPHATCITLAFAPAAMAAAMLKQHIIILLRSGVGARIYSKCLPEYENIHRLKVAFGFRAPEVMFRSIEKCLNDFRKVKARAHCAS